LQIVEKEVAGYVEVADYTQALESIARLREPVDTFFDSVMVMADDVAIKNNRLALLTSISRLFKEIADFSKIA